MKKVTLSILAGLAALWIIGIILVNVFNIDLDSYFSAPTLTRQTSAATSSDSASIVADSEWRIFKSDDFHFTIETPFELKNIQSQVNASTGNSVALFGSLISNKMALRIDESEGAGHFAVKPDERTFAFDKKMVEGRMKVAQGDSKIGKNFQFSITEVTLRGANGVEGDATFQIDGYGDWEWKIIYVRKDLVSVEIFLQYPSDPPSRAVVDRILKSLKITN